MAINYEQLRDCVIIPTLQYLDPEIPYSDEAVDLLMLTCAHESNLGTYLKQVGGPACGIFQLEPDTHDDIWGNYISYRGGIEDKINRLSLGMTLPAMAHSEESIYNLPFATAMARVHYYRVPESIPKKKDFAVEDDYLQALACYAKRHFNTHLGKAKSSDYYWAYQKYCT